MSGITVDRFVDAGLDCEEEGALEEALALLCYELPDRYGSCPACGQLFSNGSRPGHSPDGCNPLKSLLAVARVVRAFYRRARFLIRASATGARPPVAVSGGTGVPPSGSPASSFSPLGDHPQDLGELRAPAGRARSSASRGTNRGDNES